ncbi:MAG: LacI family transcriptional regulator [Clostridia bacterium]|nr:LacI family transcriptional regulator [Clostridia bacterium]
MRKRVTIYDIAKELGISTATVNRALTGKPKVSEKTRALVLRQAKEMGYQVNFLARSLARRPVTIAVLGYTNFPEFHNRFMDGARSAAEELRDFNINVEYFSYGEGLSNRPEGEAYLGHILRSVADQGYDGALICAKEVEGFRYLQEKGVFVATAVNDIDPMLRQFCLRYNGRVAGRIAAELLYRWMDRGKSVAIASGGLPGHSIHSETVVGFQEQAADTPLRIAMVYYHYDSEELAYRETHRVLTECPDLGAIYVNSFNSREVIHAIRERDLAGKILLITSDIYQELREYMTQGIVAASIFQNQYEQGRQGFKKLYHAIADGLQVEDTVLLNPRIILRSNLELF